MPSRTALALSRLVALLCALALPAYGQETRPAGPPDRPPDDRGSFSFVVENDMFTGADRHYTSGVHASWLSPEDDLPGFGRWLARNLPMLAPEGRKRIGYAIGQSMFTPDEIERRDLIPEDRPYAGWLFGEIGITSETAGRLDSAVLSVGVVGPASGAEFAQRTWHRWIGSGDPNGWSHQLKNEPTVNLMLDRQWRYLWTFRTLGYDADVTPHVGGALGNVFTHAATGATLRFGRSLEDDFGGPPRVRPSLPGAAHFTPRDRFGWYVFAGFEGRAVARNVFLDGNTFRSSHSVNKRPLVADLQAGLALVFPRFRVTYTYVHRTEEFYGQGAPDRFAALSLTARF